MSKQSTQQNKLFVNVHEAAELLQCNAQTVRNLHHKGAFKGRIVGNKLLLDVESVKEYVRGPVKGVVVKDVVARKVPSTNGRIEEVVTEDEAAAMLGGITAVWDMLRCIKHEGVTYFTLQSVQEAKGGTIV